MNNKLIILLALDSLLLDMDEEYERIEEEQLQLINSKVLESYGLTITSQKEEFKNIKSLMIQDIKKYREQLIKEI